MIASSLSAPRNDAPQRASILLIALWALFILSGFAVILGSQVRQQMVLVKRLEARNKLTAIADAAIPLGIVEVKKFAQAAVFALSDTWSNDPKFKDIPVADGTCTFIRPSPEPAAIDQASGIGMVDEESKININKADIKCLASLMKVAVDADDVEAQGLAGSLIDWRDADDELVISQGSAESSYYRNGKYPYEAKNALFQTLDEVRLVKGFSANVFEKLKNYITIYGSGRVNVNTAGKVVLNVIGFPPAAAEDLLKVRAGKDGIAGTGDDGSFSSITDVVPAITEHGGFSSTELAAMNEAVGTYATVKSTAFTITSIGKAPGYKDDAQVDCVIDLKGRILAYHQY